MSNGKNFFEVHAGAFENQSSVRVVDVGAQDVNGSLRQVCPSHFEYIGLDFQKARGVDIVLDDPYSLPLESESVDIVVSSSCFEHSEMFWLSYLEILRILKPGGLFYLNAPSDGGNHRYPVDCWRFYPDSGRALRTWARRNGYTTEVLESYIQLGGGWHDFVCIFIRDEMFIDNFKNRILHQKKDFENGYLFGGEDILNLQVRTQNERSLRARSLRGLVDLIGLRR